MGVNSLPKTVTRQRRDCDLNPGPTAPESSTLTTRLPSHTVTADVRVTNYLTINNHRVLLLSYEQINAPRVSQQRGGLRHKCSQKYLHTEPIIVVAFAYVSLLLPRVFAVFGERSRSFQRTSRPTFDTLHQIFIRSPFRITYSLLASVVQSQLEIHASRSTLRSVGIDTLPAFMRRIGAPRTRVSFRGIRVHGR